MKSLGDDQTRTMSPKEAIDNGSNFLVIGRPITASTDIKNSLQEIYDSINNNFLYSYEDECISYKSLFQFLVRRL